MLSKFLNTRTLLILLVILVGIYFMTTLTDKKDRTFQSQLVQIDTAEVTKIEILPKTGGGDEIRMTKTGDEWSLESNGKTYQPDESAINNILAELLRMRTERVAATDDSKWKELEVTDSTATRVKIYGGDELLSDLYLGKFSYTQAPQQNPYQRQQPRMFTHIRPAGDEKVYVVEGFIKMSVQPNLDTYRAKTLAEVDPANVTSVSFNYPDMSFTLTNDNNIWKINGEPVDSSSTVRYLGKFRKLTSNNFIDDVIPESGEKPYVVTIEGNNFIPIELRAMPADSVNQYVITSSLIPDSKYSGSKGKLFERVFVQPDEFLANKPE
ncbi:MAG: DUF4340 domain-containing protein [Bacteroidetes bacterium]|nr:DUF4340 domain-containing protein [Bacteroidota bacterium]